MKRFLLFALLFGTAILALSAAPNTNVEAQKPEARLTPWVPITSPAMTRVVAGLTWLADHQSDGGYWNPEFFQEDSLRREVGAVVDGQADLSYDPHGASTERSRASLGGGQLAAAEGIAAVSLLAFLKSGNNLQDGPYAENVRRAAAWLMARQDSTGCFSRRATGRLTNNEVWTYNHAFALLALSECQIVSPQDAIKEALKQGAAFARAIVNEKSGGWGYSEKATRIDVALTALMAYALSRADKAGIAAALDGAFAKTLDGWLTAQEAGSERNYLVASGNAQSQLIPTNWSALPLPTLLSLMARVDLGIASAIAPKTKAQNSNLRDTGTAALREPFFMGFGLSTTRQLAAIESISWVSTIYQGLQESQRGYRASEIGKFAGAGSPDGRKSLDEHGSWDPVGQWADLGGRPFATAMNVMAMLAYAEMKNEKTDLSKIDSSGDGKLVPWVGEDAGLAGRTPDDLIKGFWTRFVPPVRNLKTDATQSRYGLVDGKVVPIEQMFVSNIYFSDDTKTMKRSESGEPVIEFTMTGASHDTRYFLPLRGEEWGKDAATGEYQALHAEAMQASRTEDAIGLTGPHDPRFGWYDIVWEWYFKIDVTELTWAERCGAALWFDRFYSNYPWAAADDQGNAVWNGYADEILLESLRFGDTKEEWLYYVAAYQRQQPELRRDTVYFYLDTYLTPQQVKVREGLQKSDDSFLSWYDAYYAEKRAKQVAGLRSQPAVKSLRDECREVRKTLIEEARKRVLAR